MARQDPDERIVLRLTGSEADHGLPWANLAAFVDNIRRALRDYDRQRQGARTGREGRPAAREDLVTAFRLVSFKPGSAIMELEPIAAPPTVDDAQTALPEVEKLAVENLRAFIDSIESNDDVLDPSITEAVEEARRELGDDGRIEITVGRSRRPRKRTVIDARRIAVLEARAQRKTPRLMTVTGRLHINRGRPRHHAVHAR